MNTKPELQDIEEVFEYLDGDYSYSTILSWIVTGKLPYQITGKHQNIMLDQQDVYNLVNDLEGI